MDRSDRSIGSDLMLTLLRESIVPAVKTGRKGGSATTEDKAVCWLVRRSSSELSGLHGDVVM